MGSSGKRSRSPRENDNSTADVNAPLSQQWTAPPDLERTLAYALPHAVVPQLLRPSVLEPFLWPYCIKLRTHRDAMVAVTSVVLKSWGSLGRKPSDWKYPWSLPHVTSVKFAGAVDLADVFVGAPPTLRRLDFSKSTLIHADFAKHMPRFENIDELSLEKCQSFVPRSGLEYVSTLHTLRVLNLRACTHIDGESLGQLAELRLLEVLDLTRCGGVNSESLKRIGTLSNLRTLLMRGCEDIDSDALSHVAKIPRLTKLEVALTTLDDAALAHIGNCSKLRCLILAWCTFSPDPQFRFISGLSQLEVLDLSGADVGTPELAQLRPLFQLRELTLDSCFSEPLCLCDIAAFRNVEKLDLSICASDEKMLTHVAKLPKLKTLLLTETTFPAVEALLPLSSTLTHLDLSLCGKVGPGAALLHVARLTSLRVLDLSNTSFEDDDLGVLSPLRCLRRLDVMWTPMNPATFRAVNHPLLETFAISMEKAFSPGDSFSQLLTELQTMQCLHQLHLSAHNEVIVGPDFIREIAALPRLRTLKFTSCRFKQDALKCAPEFPALHMLTFERCGRKERMHDLPPSVLLDTRCIPNVIVEW